MRMNKTIIRTIVASLLMILVGILVSLSAFTIDVGERGIVKRFGKISYIADAGLNFKIPFIDKVDIYNVKVQEVDIDGVVSTSKDAMAITTRVNVQYQISPLEKDIMRIYPQFGSEANLREKLFDGSFFIDKVKQAMGQYQTNQVPTSREEIARNILLNIRKILKDEYGIDGEIEIVTLSIPNVSYPNEYTDAIKEREVAQKQVDTEQARLERQAIQVQQGIQQAKADAEMVRINAEAEANRRLTIAQAEALSIELVGTQLDTYPSYLTRQLYEQWNGGMPATLVNNGGDGALFASMFKGIDTNK